MDTLAERSDEVLARSAACGDIASFEALVHRYGVRLYQFLRLSCKLSPEAAEDTANEVWIRVWCGLPNSSVYYFRAWLFTIARNAAVRHSLQAARRPEVRLDSDHTDPNVQPPDRPAEVADEAAKLAACRDQLPPHLKAVFDGFARGQTDKELASVMGVEAGTVRTRWHRAKALVRACMGEG